MSSKTPLWTVADPSFSHDNAYVGFKAMVEALPRTPTHKVEKYKLRERILKEIKGI